MILVTRAGPVAAMKRQKQMTPLFIKNSYDHANSFHFHSLSSVRSLSCSCIITMSLDPPTYLNSWQNNIRARPIPWEGAVRTGTITDNDLKRIKAVDKVRKEQRRQTVEADPEAYQVLLLGGEGGKSVLESSTKRADIIQYILVLAGDLINGMPLNLLRSLES